MEYFRGFSVFFDDPDCVRNLLLASLLLFSSSFIPFVGQMIVIGWAGFIVRETVRGRLQPVPRLDFDVDLLLRQLELGFKMMVVRFAWSVVLFFPLIVVWVVGLIAAGAFSSGGSAGGGFVLLALLCGGLLTVAWCLVGGVFIWLAALRTAITGKLGDGFAVGVVLAMCRTLFGEAVLAAIVLAFAGIVLTALGVLLLFIGVFPATALVMVLQAHVGAQLYERWLDQGGDPLPIEPLPEQALQRAVSP